MAKTKQERTLEELQKQFDELKKEQDKPCPSCGHCPHCGHAPYRTLPRYPWDPYVPWNPSPYWQVLPETTPQWTVTCGGNSIESNQTISLSPKLGSVGWST